jgi:hypothetical protein
VVSGHVYHLGKKRNGCNEICPKSRKEAVIDHAEKLWDNLSVVSDCHSEGNPTQCKISWPFHIQFLKQIVPNSIAYFSRSTMQH